MTRNEKIKLLRLVIALVIIGFTVWQSRNQPPKTAPSPGPAETAVLGEQTKITACQIKLSLPDPACTPGAVFADVSVTQICTSGYTKTVRDVSQATKRQVYAAYSISDPPAGVYEVDHLVSLSLGGSNDIANLWPNAINPRPGSNEKDIASSYLRKQVCDGRLTLAEAQKQIATNWVAVYEGIR